MRLALDTNRYVDFCRGKEDVLQHLRHAERVCLPFVVLAELRAGFLSGTRAQANERILTRFLSSPRVRSLYPDEQTTHHYARIFKYLRQHATPVPTNDIWIAALVLQHQLVLYARDQHFDHLPQLPRL
jgi:predicted nucleic acid-binding protein